MNTRMLVERVLASLQNRRHGEPRLLFRRIWVGIHRTLALTVGFVFVLMGLSGSLNAFQPELDAWFNPHLTVPERSGEYRSPDEMLAAIKAVHPRRFGGWTLEMPRRPSEMLTAWFDKPIESSDEYHAPLMVSVNPYTAEVVASRFWGDTVTTWILELHGELFMGEFGRKLIGCLGVLLMFSLVTGLALWWPGRRRIRESLRLKIRTTPQRLLFDLHRMAGVYSALVLLVVAFTGFHFVYPSILESVFKSASSMGDIHEGLNVRSTAVPNSKPVTAEESVLLARGLFPKSPVQRILTPQDANGSYQVWFGRVGATATDAPSAVVCVDQYSGHILHVENLRNRPAGDVFLSFLRPLHTGAALGLPGRILWSIAGMVPLFLYITGIQRWRRRRVTGLGGRSSG